jgi:predicted nucleic acid-binding protein
VLTVEDFEEAARANNTCRAAGVAGTLVDMLLCAVAARLDAPVFTTDADFTRYARHLPLRLHRPGEAMPPPGAGP